MDERIAALRMRSLRFLHERPAEGELGRYAAFADPVRNGHEPPASRRQQNCHGNRRSA